MNVAVINLKDIFKYLVKILIIICSVLVITKISKNVNLKKQEENIKNTVTTKTKQIKRFPFLSCLDYSSILSYNKEDNQKEKALVVGSILERELGILTNVKENIHINETEEIKMEEEIISNIEIGKDVTTENIEANNIEPKYTNSYGTVEINNQSDYQMTEEILVPNVEITNKKDILIYHTHTCESYTPTEAYNYEMTGNYRTTDLNYSVARVGTELKNQLEKRGFNVTHNTTYHDYPTYSGSYTKSLETINNLLQDNDVQMVIDIHRDAVGSNNEYSPKVKVNGEEVAQLMFVIRNRRRRIRTS